VSLEDISAEMQVPLELVEGVLQRIQQFDPLGVAARELKECLLIQLEQMTPRDSIAEKIVSEHLQLLKNRNYAVIAKRLGVSTERVSRAAFLISKPSPNRGGLSVGRSLRRSFLMCIFTNSRAIMLSI
jgi:RNA polymerase sigma-54 factor